MNDTQPTAFAGDQVIMIIRHGEKPSPEDGIHGIDPTGRRDKRSLTVHGWLRAGALAELLAPYDGRPPTGLRTPAAVYAAAADHGRSRRSIQTVEPLAQRLGVEVEDRFAVGDEGLLVEELLSRPGSAVVSWHHRSISRIVRHLGPVTPTPPAHWPADRFDVVWTFTRRGSSWRFEQVPEMLLAGDQLEPIAA